MSSNRLEQLFDFLKATPNDPFILYAIAIEYIKQKDFDQALTYFQELLHQKPDYVGAYYHFGKLYEQLGQEDQALTIYRKGMAVAQQAHDMHAFSELQIVYQTLLGIEPDDEFED